LSIEISAAASNSQPFFIPCLQAAAAILIVGRPGIVDAAGVSDTALVFLHIVADSDCVNYTRLDAKDTK
jgi:hypothetical protein